MQLLQLEFQNLPLETDLAASQPQTKHQLQ